MKLDERSAHRHRALRPPRGVSDRSAHIAWPGPRVGSRNPAARGAAVNHFKENEQFIVAQRPPFVAAIESSVPAVELADGIVGRPAIPDHPAGELLEPLYRMAVETGLRVGELRSLTRSSFDLEAVLPTVTVAAAYSKHRRQDIQPLRREFADQLRPWLDRRPAVGPVFGVPASAAGILRADMAAARDAWVLQAATDEERQRRLTNGNFLMYRDSAGRYADFHALRHTFITNLTRGNVNPRLAQSLARHSTITLTMDRYSHVTADDAAAALGVLPRLPRHTEADRLLPAPLAGPAGFDDFKGGGGPESSPKNWGENWGVPEAFRASPVTFNDIKSEIEVFQGSREGQRNIAIFRLFQALFSTRPEGLEPPTSGLEIRCSVQLSYGRKSFIHNTLQTTKHRCRNRSWRLSSQLSFGGSIDEIARCIVENTRRPADIRSAARTLRVRRCAVQCSNGPIVRLAGFNQRRTSFSRTRRLGAVA